MIFGPHRRTDHLPPTGDPLLSSALQSHVHALASEIGERNVRTPHALAQARDYIETYLGGERQTYTVQGVPCDNVIATLPGPMAEWVVVGAHYDSVIQCPGANDNASGVAALLELTRLLKDLPRRRGLKMVAFVNEEPPWFDTEQMGSYVYAAEARQRGEQIHAMISLETLGCYLAEPHSQQYPPPMGLMLPHRGNFIAVVSNFTSQWLMRAISRTIIDRSQFPVESLAAPSVIPGIDWSDHGSFWKHHYAAAMLTDTAPYRYQPYHTADDTEEKVDYPRLAALTEVLVPVIQALID
ncbi:MAG: M28 family peptidase [Candidatus Xenobia bacterium]